jgi:hypothetical protein
MGHGYRDEERGAISSFAPVLLANLLPLGGFIWFGWHIREVLVIYWLEILVTLILYSGAALFAERRIVLEGRTLFLPGVNRKKELDESTWGTDPEGVRLADRLPLIYRRNARLVWRSLVWGIGFSALPLVLYQSAIEAAISPAVVGSVLVMAVSQLAEIRREFFGEQKYEAMSAHMVLEIPCRIIFFMGAWILLLQTVGIFFLLGVGAVFGSTAKHVRTENVIEIVYVTVLVLGKFTVEWARFRANHEENPGRIRNWFTPQDPLAE